jgi:hypothetical protein
MSQSTAPATRNEVTRRFNPPKVTTFAALPIEHAVTSTVAIGCEHKSSVERTRLNPKGCIQEKVSVKKKFMAIEI